MRRYGSTTRKHRKASAAMSVFRGGFWLDQQLDNLQKRHASVMMTFLSHLNESNQVTVALKTFRERVRPFTDPDDLEHPA